MLRGPDARLRLVTALLIAALLPVLGQLLRLQVLDRDQYRTEVEELVHRPYALPEPPKGIIMDRNGDLLIGNAPIYNVGAEINLIGICGRNRGYLGRQLLGSGTGSDSGGGSTPASQPAAATGGGGSADDDIPF